MNGHVDQWIDAYLDGQLPAVRHKQVTQHLAECGHCRMILEQRRSLSTLLQEAPPAAGVKPAEQFVSEVNLKIRTRRAPVIQRVSFPLAWQLAPVGLLIAWAFIQTVSILSSLLGFIPGAEALLQREVSSLPATSGIIGSLGRLGLDALSLFGPISLLDWSWLTSLVLLLMIAVLYLGWLATWWAHSREQG